MKTEKVSFHISVLNANSHAIQKYDIIEAYKGKCLFVIDITIPPVGNVVCFKVCPFVITKYAIINHLKWWWLRSLVYFKLL